MRILRRIRRKCRKIKLGLFLIFIIFLFIIGLILLPEPSTYNECGEPVCKTCKVVATCIRFEEINDSHEYLHFKVKNQNTKAGDCFAEIKIKSGDMFSRNFTHDIGIIQPGETINEKVVIVPPDGETNFGVTPYCDFYG